MHCWSCGNEVEENSNICMKCGVRISTTGTSVDGKKDSSMTLGIIGACFALFIPIVTFICSGLGTGKAYDRNNKNAKTLNIVALSVALVVYLLTTYIFPDTMGEIYEKYFNFTMN